MTTPTPADPDGHETAFEAMPEESRLVHLIEHGHWLRSLRELSEADLDQLHAIAHSHRDGKQPRTAPPDLAELTDKAAKMATALRVHVLAERWSEAYACADWLADLADEIHSHVWAAYPDARPERW